MGMATLAFKGNIKKIISTPFMGVLIIAILKCESIENPCGNLLHLEIKD
jgi:hypothetical protein